jgi:hypothetical protein
VLSRRRWVSHQPGAFKGAIRVVPGEVEGLAPKWQRGSGRWVREVLLLTEQWWGLPARAYAPTRGWGGPDMDAGFQRLSRRGLMTDDEQLTDAGRAFREEVEVRTDELERPVLEALGDDLEELLEHLDAWSEAIIAAGSYPQRIAGVYNVGGGPHFGSGLTIDTAAEQYANKP